MSRKAMLWGGLGVIVVLALVIVVRGFLTPLVINHPWKVAEHKDAPAPKYDPATPMVGLALSGGGARASVFSAAGMQALAARGLLDPVTHVSSVSGGGFPSAYLATHPLPDCRAAINVNDRASCYADYFDTKMDVMRRNFLNRIHWGQATHPLRLLVPSARVKSLQGALDTDDFLGGSTLADLQDGRAYYYNTVSYDTGRRFILTNDRLADPNADSAQVLPQAVRALSFSEGATFDSVGSVLSPDVLRSTPADFPLSLAVATSAAFPPYLGPVTIHKDTGNKLTDQFWHLGDGGVVENTGLETLREVLLGQPERQPAVIYVFDAGQRLDKDLSSRTHDLSIWSRDVTRLVDVLVEYAGGHRAALAEEIDVRLDVRLRVFTFDYQQVEGLLEEIALADTLNGVENPDPRLAEWDVWPASCGTGDRGDSESPAAHLKEVPTSFQISPCNADLIARAAEFLVEYHLPAAQH